VSETVYTLYPEIATDERGRYFDGQFLTAQDFVDEQRYHVDRLRRALDHLTIAGVADGLELAPAGPWRVSLTSGTAIDGLGRLLVVVSKRDNLDVPKDIPGGSLDVALCYAEVESRVAGGTSEEQGTRGATRLRELPALEYYATGGAPKRPGAVPIARITLAVDGTVAVVAPNPVRRFTGLRFASSGDAPPTLRSGAPARPKLLEGTGDLAIAGKLAVGTLDPEAELDVRGTIRATALSRRERTFKVAGDEATFYPIVFRDLDWSAGTAELEIVRTIANTDAQGAGALQSKIRWHAGDGQGCWLLDVEILQTARFIALARQTSGDKLLAVWLRGNRTYAWRANQRVDLVDDKAATKQLGGETLNPRNDIDPAFDRDRVQLGVTVNRQEIRGGLTVSGGIAGKLDYLDTSEQGAVTLRAADLVFGHSTRRGNPGRALVDNKDALVVNFGPDWPITRLGGDVEATANLKVVKDLAVDGATKLNKGAAVTGNLSVTADLSVTGSLTAVTNITYSGKQSRLDVAEQNNVTLRAYDLLFGHSTRRGNPGRAFVDSKDTLVVNWGPDWPTTVVGGNIVEIHGTLVARKDVAVNAQQVITREADHLVLRRATTETAGGPKIMLELFQQDVNPAKVPEVGPSIRFHHNYRFWHRLEARGDGLHVCDGDVSNNNYHSFFAGNLFSNGQHTVTGATERLRTIRGVVNADGNRVHGKGFSCSKQGRLYKVKFEPAFSDEPTFVCTQQGPDSNDDGRTDGGNTKDNALIVSCSREYALVKTGDNDGDHSWRRFHFIAMGVY
jgi:hypothetical protein